MSKSIWSLAPIAHRVSQLQKPLPYIYNGCALAAEIRNTNTHEISHIGSWPNAPISFSDILL